MGIMRHISEKGFKLPDLERIAAEHAFGVTIADVTPQAIETPVFAGSMLTMEVQPGLIVAASDLVYLNDTPLASINEPAVSCGVLLEGDDEFMEVEGYGSISRTRGRAAIKGFSRTTRLTLPSMRGHRSRAAGVLIRPTFFERFGERIDDDGVAALREFAETDFRYEYLPKSPKLCELARRCFDHPYNNQLGELFLESNALAFIVEVAQMLSHERRMVELLGRRHYDRVMEARSILDDSLVKPPTILELTRRVGVNLTTLQANFKLAFGTTIFGYVRTQRLEVARVLLIEHRLSISEAGYRVGFSSPSAFTAAYRRHFGHPPGRELRHE